MGAGSQPLSSKPSEAYPLSSSTSSFFHWTDYVNHWLTTSSLEGYVNEESWYHNICLYSKRFDAKSRSWGVMFMILTTKDRLPFKSSWWSFAMNEWSFALLSDGFCFPISSTDFWFRRQRKQKTVPILSSWSRDGFNAHVPSRHEIGA